MKHLFLIAVFSALFPLFLHAADPNPEQDPVLLKAKLAILEADRAKTMNELTDLRMKHIRSDKNSDWDVLSATKTAIPYYRFTGIRNCCIISVLLQI